MNSLTLKEQEAVAELKRRIGDEIPQDLKIDTYVYHRFLRARDFDVNLAEEMLRNHLVWRKANHIATILTDFVPPNTTRKIETPEDNGSKCLNGSETQNSRIGVVIKYLPLTRIGFDKEGAPVRYFAFGNMDSKGILKSAKRNECIKAVIQCFEDDVTVMRQQSAKLGKPIEQWTYIFDFENYSFAKATHKPTLEALIALFVIYEANYPERLKAAYMINASIYFSIAFAIIKPLLSGATLKKITIYGKDGWKQELLRHIPAEVLPVFLGGTRTDPDENPLCNTIVKHGAIVPEEYYMTRTIERLSNQLGVKKMRVSRMSKVHIIFDVPEPGSLLEWEFETESRDIGFALFYRDNDCVESALKELVPKQRIDTHIASEVGMYQCDKPGTYVMVFDNSYSWIHQKEIYCKAVVVTSSGQRIQMVE